MEPPTKLAKVQQGAFGELVMAPMVRGSKLPLRLLALRHGASWVMSEEVVAHKLRGCSRDSSEAGVVRWREAGGRVALSSCAEERERMSVQLGVADPDLALEAASLVAQDVAGVDVNMGCPKRFSVQGGMGAALLDDPARACGIVRRLAVALGDTSVVSCKIRLLAGETRHTTHLVLALKEAGAQVVTVHGRRRPDRTEKVPADWDAIKAICAVSPVYLNGDVACYTDFARARQETGCLGAMSARAALRNPSAVFRSEGALPGVQMAREYLELAVRYDNHPSNSKWVLQQMLQSGVDEVMYAGVTKAKTHEELLRVVSK